MDWLLFAAAFVSATLFPGGSEALVVMRVLEGGDRVAIVATATAGNVLGSLVTWVMGHFGRRLAAHSARSEARLKRAQAWFARYGQASLLLAWLPVIGDPLCFVAGLLRVRLLNFLLLVTAGKLARYAALVWLV